MPCRISKLRFPEASNHNYIIDIQEESLKKKSTGVSMDADIDDGASDTENLP
jgi:hypothetical protein